MNDDDASAIRDALDLATIRRMAVTGEARRIREQARLATSEVAAPVGVSRVTVTRWETGARRPTGPAALRWLAVLRRLQLEAVTSA